MSDTSFEIHVDVSRDGLTALDWLADDPRVSRAQVKQAMAKGAVWLTQGKSTRRLRRAKKTLPASSSLHLYYNERVLATRIEGARLIADEQRYSAWYKPYGMWSQGSKWGDHCTIYRWAEQHFSPQRTAFLVHRLDRAATGLILLAHDKAAARALAELFSTRQLEKTYQVIVQGEFPAGEVQTFREPLDKREACSHAQRLGYAPLSKHSLLQVQIETGRKHQIRRHLALAGFPVLGDRLYGSAQEEGDLQLTASRLAFECPLTGEHRDYQLPAELLPDL